MWDEKMIRAIQAGDERAIGQVMDRYSRLLWSVAGAVLREAPDQDVEECVADAFIYLWQHPERYDPRRGKLRSWLVVIAKSRALDRARQLARRTALPLSEEILEAEAPGGLPDSALEDDLDALLQDLSEEEREVLRRRYRDEQKPAEIARDLGVPVKQVENRLYRGKQKLRKGMESKEVLR